jgi:hypothetical protein
VGITYTLSLIYNTVYPLDYYELVFNCDSMTEPTNKQSDNEAGRRKKIKAVNKSAQGNYYKFPQQNHSKNGQSTSSDIAAASILDREYFINDCIRRDIANLTDCCAKGRGVFGGCLLKHFGYHEVLQNPGDSAEDIISSTTSAASSLLLHSSSSNNIQCRDDAVEAATAYVRLYREQGKTETQRDREERDSFIQEIFRGCILSEEHHTNSAESSKKFEMQYEIPSVDNKLGKRNRLEVCVGTLQCVYGITAYEWRLCNEQLKKTDSGRVSSLRNQPWGDDYLHDFTYAEVENVFLRNLPDTPIASKLLLVV